MREKWTPYFMGVLAMNSLRSILDPTRLHQRIVFTCVHSVHWLFKWSLFLDKLTHTLIIVTSWVDILHTKDRQQRQHCIRHHTMSMLRAAKLSGGQLLRWKALQSRGPSGGELLPDSNPAAESAVLKHMEDTFQVINRAGLAIPQIYLALAMRWS